MTLFFKKKNKQIRYFHFQTFFLALYFFNSSTIENGSKCSIKCERHHVKPITALMRELESLDDKKKKEKEKAKENPSDFEISF